jgi:hypothetical protein
VDFDQDKVDKMVLALLSLTVHDENEWGARAWKTHDWGAMERLFDKGYISDPKGNAKSVVLSPEGLKLARDLFERYFAKAT